MDMHNAESAKSGVGTAYVAEIVGAIVTVLVGYSTGVFVKLADVYLMAQTSPILSQLEVTFNAGGPNTNNVLGNHIASCNPPDLPVGRFCEAHGPGVLQNFGVDIKSKQFVCVSSSSGFPTG
ncbi:hypothetical protein [Paraburkholderia sp. 32]|uniref:hypothetical protein n=1 Tax=Paraburkholderia sp. 32 TaxID=2991057 RepID=UPI003D207E56